MPLDTKPVTVEDQISNAETVVISCDLSGAATVKIALGVEEKTLHSQWFLKAIDGLVMPGIDEGDISKIVMQRVSPEIMFDTTPRIDYFRISFHGADGAQLGGRDTLKNRDEVAAKLAPKLSPA